MISRWSSSRSCADKHFSKYEAGVRRLKRGWKGLGLPIGESTRTVL